MEQDDVVVKAGSLIPEIYCDVIARIIPGCVILCGAAILTYLNGYISIPPIDKWCDMSFSVGSITVLAVMGAGYLLGVIITPWGRPVISIIRIIRKHVLGKEAADIIIGHTPIIVEAISAVPLNIMISTVRGLPSIAYTKAIERQDRYELDHFLYEYVRLKCPQSDIIAKMRAEMGSCRNLTVSFLVLLLATIACVGSISHWSLAVLTMIILVYLAVKAALYREQAYYERLVSFLYLARICKKEISDNN